MRAFVIACSAAAGASSCAHFDLRETSDATFEVSVQDTDPPLGPPAAAFRRMDESHWVLLEAVRCDGRELGPGGTVVVNERSEPLKRRDSVPGNPCRRVVASLTFDLAELGDAAPRAGVVVVSDGSRDGGVIVDRMIGRRSLTPVTPLVGVAPGDVVALRWATPTDAVYRATARWYDHESKEVTIDLARDGDDVTFRIPDSTRAGPLEVTLMVLYELEQRACRGFRECVTRGAYWRGMVLTVVDPKPGVAPTASPASP